MENQNNNQEITPQPNPDLVFLAMRQIGLKQKSAAKELNCTQGAISQALAGENMGLLERLDKLVKRKFRAKEKKASTNREAA